MKRAQALRALDSLLIDAAEELGPWMLGFHASYCGERGGEAGEGESWVCEPPRAFCSGKARGEARGLKAHPWIQVGAAPSGEQC